MFVIETKNFTSQINGDKNKKNWTRVKEESKLVHNPSCQNHKQALDGPAAQHTERAAGHAAGLGKETVVGPEDP